MGECGSLSMMWKSSCWEMDLPRGSVCCVESQTVSCALKSPSMKVSGRVVMCSMSGVYPEGQEEIGGIYILAMLMSCLCTLIRVVWSSVYSSGLVLASVCSVVCVKGMLLFMSVMRPPPPALCLSFRRVVYPANFGVCVVLLSLVSWMTAT